MLDRVFTVLFVIFALAVIYYGYQKKENVKSREAAGTYSVAPPAPATCAKIGNCYSCHMIDRGKK